MPYYAVQYNSPALNATYGGVVGDGICGGPDVSCSGLTHSISLEVVLVRHTGKVQVFTSAASPHGL